MVRGRAELKRRIAEAVRLPPDTLAWNPTVLEEIAAAQTAGRSVWLASTSECTRGLAARRDGRGGGPMGSTSIYDGTVEQLGGEGILRVLAEIIEKVWEEAEDSPVWPQVHFIAKSDIRRRDPATV